MTTTPSISVACEGIFAAPDTLLVPTIPTPRATRTLVRRRRHPAKEGPAGIEVLPFFSMTDRRKALYRQICNAVTGRPFPLLAAEIPYASLVAHMGVCGAPLPTFAHRTRRRTATVPCGVWCGSMSTRERIAWTVSAAEATRRR